MSIKAQNIYLNLIFTESADGKNADLSLLSLDTRNVLNLTDDDKRRLQVMASWFEL